MRLHVLYSIKIAALVYFPKSVDKCCNVRFSTDNAADCTVQKAVVHPVAVRSLRSRLAVEEDAEVDCTVVAVAVRKLEAEVGHKLVLVVRMELLGAADTVGIAAEVVLAVGTEAS